MIDEYRRWMMMAEWRMGGPTFRSCLLIRCTESSASSCPLLALPPSVVCFFFAAEAVEPNPG